MRESDTGNEAVAVFALRVGGLLLVKCVLGSSARLSLGIYLDYIGE